MSKSIFTMPLPACFSKAIFCLILVLVVLSGCHDGSKTATKKSIKKTELSKTDSNGNVLYPEAELVAYLDSIGHLPIQPMAVAAARGADSVFKNIIHPFNKVLNAGEFEALKRAARTGMISAHIAKEIFPGLPVDTGCNAKSLLDSVKKGFIYVQYFPFNRDKNKFNEFAIRIGNSKHCAGSELYFFRGNKLIAEEDRYAKYDDDLEYVMTIDGQSIFYQVYEFTDGSGVWWNNYFFYKYEGDKLIPVLNELENGNLQDYRGPRALWLESTITKKDPLTVKMVYYVYLNRHLDSIDKDTSLRIINDSTIVRYKWDSLTKTFEGQFAYSKINRLQVLSYTLGTGYNLFIPAYYARLKEELNNKRHRAWVLAYLNKTKNESVRAIKRKKK